MDEYEEMPIWIQIEWAGEYLRNFPQPYDEGPGKGRFQGRLSRSGSIHLTREVLSFPYLDIALPGKGVSVIACNTALSFWQAYDLKPSPNFVVERGDEVNVLWFLENYVGEQATVKERQFHRSILRKLLRHAQGTRLDTVLSPFCLTNEAVKIESRRYKLIDLKPPKLTDDEVKAARVEAGKVSAGRIRQGSISRIVDAILQIRDSGAWTISKAQVARVAGVGYSTVSRCWNDEAVREARKDASAIDRLA